MPSVKQTNLRDVLEIQPTLYNDQRGFFLETFQKNKYRDLGIPYDFLQDNWSGSAQGTLRGLHFQSKHPQGKLVFPISGRIFDVAVDLRRGSPAFGKHIAIVLSSEHKNQLWIPPGFAHGFYVLSDWADVIYKTTDYYHPEWESTLLWNDPDLGINFPLIDNIPLLISEKDKKGQRLNEIETSL